MKSTLETNEVNLFPRPLEAQTPVRNPITRTLFWLSKTDPQLVSLCSRWANATQAAFGVFVIFTAALAFASVYYTLSTLNVSSTLVPWIATAWAIFVLFLEREIAGSLDKKSAFVRPILALFLGTLTAIPIELYIYQDRVDQELQRQYRKDNREQLDALDAADAQLAKRRSDIQATLDDLRKQDTEWAKVLDAEAAGRSGPGRTGVRGVGPAFQNAQSQQEAIRQRMREVRRDLERLEAQEPEARKRAERRYERLEVGKVTDFVTRYEALDKVLHTSTPLYRLSWLITLALILIEMTLALLKLLTPHVDYHHLVRAEMRENVTRIDEISERNYRLAIENPEAPVLSVGEKFALSRSTQPNVSPLGEAKRSAAPNRSQTPSAKKGRRPVVIAQEGFDQPYLDQLCDSLLHLFGDTPRPTVSIHPAGNFENANAHCRYPQTAGEPCSIEFNEEYLRSATEQAVHNTMKHELIHAWMHFMKIADTDPHGAVFVMKGRELGCDVDRFEQALTAEQKRANSLPRKAAASSHG